MEKDIGTVKKNNDTEIVIRIDDFGGKRGVTIREFVKSDRYTGFTKAGTRIPASQFKIFKAFISEITEKDLEEGAEPVERKEEKKAVADEEESPIVEEEY
ncbi:MAG: hypothetical protein WCK90_02015 [archaeon]